MHLVLFAATLVARTFFLPIMPTVPFLLIAAFCFARSNPAWEQRILDHPYWGPQVRDWNERRAIPRPAKYMAIGGMSAAALITGAWLISSPNEFQLAARASPCPQDTTSRACHS